jgi:predicted RNA-binding Zn ribbon-like protein
MTPDWLWDGGRVCLDLVNTLRDRWSGGRETLHHADHLTRWLNLAGLVEPSARARTKHLHAARELREAIDATLRAVTDGKQLPDDSIAVINTWAAYRPAPRLCIDAQGSPTAGVSTPADSVTAALGVLAVDAIELITSAEAGAVRVCASPRCGMRFEDRSPAQNRQWCSMSRCGNRAKARQHYARRQGQTE